MYIAIKRTTACIDSSKINEKTSCKKHNTKMSMHAMNLELMIADLQPSLMLLANANKTDLCAYLL